MEQENRTVAKIAQRILAETGKAISGKDEVLLWVLCAILAGGHILLEDIPGVGKTTMALAFSKAMGLDCNRVQFTPDVLPSDVTGYSVLNQQTGELAYQRGAVLCNLFLADELNRATSRTQSALLEAMEEGQVTVDGISHPIPDPFIVLATQNPTGAAGTQLLPDSQMDRFMVRLSLGYPDARAEANMIFNRQSGDPLKAIVPVISAETLSELRRTVASTYISPDIVHYAVALIASTRQHPQISRGASPRATLSVIAMAKATAQLRERDYVTPTDIQGVWGNTLSHRLLLSAAAQAQNITPQQLLADILAGVKAPKLF